MVTEEKVIKFLQNNYNSNTVKNLLQEVCDIKTDGDIKITVDCKNNTINYTSTNENTEIVGAEAISAMVVVLNYLEKLVINGCVIVYQLNPKKEVVLGNNQINKLSSFNIVNDFILKYIDKEIIVIESELNEYVRRGRLSLNDFNNKENISTAKRLLRMSKRSLWVAIIAGIATLITNIYMIFNH